jgi:hypothetical protein
MVGQKPRAPQDVNIVAVRGLQAKNTQFEGFLVEADHRILGFGAGALAFKFEQGPIDIPTFQSPQIFVTPTLQAIASDAPIEKAHRRRSLARTLALDN